MKVNVRGKNKFVPSEAIKSYAFEKLQKLNQYFNEKEELSANVLCKVYDSYHVVEVTIPTKNIILRAEVKAQTIYGAIDLAIDKLETQIRKHKSKIYRSLKHRQGLGNYFANEGEVSLEDMHTAMLTTSLVKNKQLDLAPMTVDDALLQMEMLGHDFFIFINSETGKVSVVYLRADDDYGIIETNK